MGLRNWLNTEIRKSDVSNAKNFSGETELNRLTTILLDVFDDQLDIGKLTLMSHASRLLDAQLRGLSRAVLTHRGNVSHDDAERHAKAEHEKFDTKRRIERADICAREIAALQATERTLPKRTRKT